MTIIIKEKDSKNEMLSLNDAFHGKFYVRFIDGIWFSFGTKLREPILFSKLGITNHRENELIWFRNE